MSLDSPELVWNSRISSSFSDSMLSGAAFPQYLELEKILVNISLVDSFPASDILKIQALKIHLRRVLC